MNAARSEAFIRAANDSDHNAIWEIIRPAIEEGTTYPVPRDMSKDEALVEFWFSRGHEVFVAVGEDGQVAGTYFLHPNERAGNPSVANCGYVTASWATGRGIGRLLCAHSVEQAKQRGFLGMQFNSVVSTNDRALKLFQSLGFKIVRTLPATFSHPTKGLVDTYVMYLGFEQELKETSQYASWQY